MQIQLALSKTSTTDNEFVDYDKKIRGTQHASQHSSKTIHPVSTTGDIYSSSPSVDVTGSEIMQSRM